MRARTSTSLSACLLFLAFGAAPALADAGPEAALSSNGEIYLAQSGACRSLFAGCPPAAANNPVLAIDVVRPGQPLERLLVPETGGPEAEGEPALLLEDSTNNLFVIWESRLSGGRSRVNLAWLHEHEWSPVAEISGAIDPLKGPPQVVITRDSYTTVADQGALVTHQRTVLHVVWWEKSRSFEQVYYTPIVVEDGSYFGSNRVYNLTNLDSSPLPDNNATLPANLSRSARLEPGATSHSVVIGFVNPITHRFLTFEVQVVLGELSQLADGIAAEMLQHADLFDGGDLVAFSDRIRSHTVEIGARLHPAVVGYVADQVAQAILDLGGVYRGNLPELSKRIRSHTVEIGARSLEGSNAGGNDHLVGGILFLDPDSSTGDVSHAIRLRQMASFPAPLVGDGTVSLLLNPDGRRAIVAWQKDDSLYYRETAETDWDITHHIAITKKVSVELAQRVLEGRLRAR
ncbi:MAG TPA: hypothetical protein PK413_09685 [Thermoanaerobaculia bacterium]|nr:hypothetical protein [Thermoanaerobaculia bacterium]